MKRFDLAMSLVALIASATGVNAEKRKDLVSCNIINSEPYEYWVGQLDDAEAALGHIEAGLGEDAFIIIRGEIERTWRKWQDRVTKDWEAKYNACRFASYAFVEQRLKEEMSVGLTYEMEDYLAHFYKWKASAVPAKGSVTIPYFTYLINLLTRADGCGGLEFEALKLRALDLKDWKSSLGRCHKGIM